MGSRHTPEGRKGPSYNALIASIDELGPLRPEDRIGSGLREEGFDRQDTFAEERTFVLDVELWEIGDQSERGAQAELLAASITERGGEVTDRYIGMTFTALRVSAPGSAIRYLLEMPLVRMVDLPPEVDLDVAPMLETTVAELGKVEPADDDAPMVAILDTGVNDAHPLLSGVVIYRTSEPSTLGLSDERGHGTRVSGIAAYGDLRECLENLERLFTTAFGTSYAAPLVSHKAALVLQALGKGSANLLRALLASSAQIPEPSLRRLQGVRTETVIHVCGYGIASPAMASTSDANRVVLYSDAEIGMDRFFVYEVPIPPEYAGTKGERQIRVTLAFDPPTRHSRSKYLGVEMSFRLVRGKSLDWVREHYRKRNKDVEGVHPDLEGKYDCSFDIRSTIRERGTLQRGTFVMKNNPAPEYGDTYYLVVRCERQWFPDEFAKQRFAVVVELSHTEDVRLYERMRERVTIRVRV